MKDQYTADFNDYLKYAFLRAVAPGQELGVVWMLTAADDRNDGAKLAYLARPDRFRSIDAVVFDTLQQLVAEGRRSIEAIEQTGILGPAVFVNARLGDTLAGRAEYIAMALDRIKDCQFAFFDPDNGLAVRSVPKGRRGSSKYLYWDELAVAYAFGHTLLIYQHFGYVKRRPFLLRLADEIRGCTGASAVGAFFTGHVAFLVIPQRNDEESVGRCVSSFTERVAPHGSALWL